MNEPLTFEEYKRQRERFIGKEDEELGLVDSGSQYLRHLVRRHIYEIEGYRCRSLEEVERVARSQGIPLRELDYRPHIVPLGAGKCDILVRFVPKHVVDKRSAWG
jgi:hypothetical protein